MQGFLMAGNILHITIIILTDRSGSSRGTGAVDDDSLMEFRLYGRNPLPPAPGAPRPPGV